MGKTLDSLYGGFPVTLPFSKSSGIAANANNYLTLPGGNGFIVPEDYVFHPLHLSVVNSYDHYEALNVNGGFETAGAGDADVFGTWTETAGNGAIASEAGETNIHEGAKSAKLTTGADELVKLEMDVAVKPGVSYILQGYFKADGTNIPRAAVYDKSNSEDIVALAAVAEEVAEVPAFEYFAVAFAAPTDCETVTITLAGAAAAGSIVYFDDIKVWVINAPETPTAQYYIAIDSRNTIAYYQDGIVASAESLNSNTEDELAFGQSPVTAGNEIKILMKTTALFAETSDTVDAVLMGVLVHE